MILTSNEKKILLNLIKKRLSADYDPDVECLRIKLENDLKKIRSQQSQPAINLVFFGGEK